MNRLLFEPETFSRLYNCSSYNVSDVPLAQRQNPPMGIAYLAAFALTELLYLPCLVVIARRARSDSCYKLMLFIGLTDVCNLCIVGLYTGLGALYGWVFCSAPGWNYAIGVISTVTWIATSMGTVALAVNRVLSLGVARRYYDALFAGKRTSLWLCVILLYAILLHGLFNIPMFYNGPTSSWQYDPHVGYLDTDPDDVCLGGGGGRVGGIGRLAGAHVSVHRRHRDVQ